jgi:serine protease Do
MDALKAILTRRVARSFAETPLELDDLQRIADAGRSLLFVGLLPFKTLLQGASMAVHPTQLPSAKSIGSGFVIDPSGEILTAEHVIRGADSIRIEVPEIGNFAGVVLGSDQDNDLALLQIINEQSLRFDAVEFGDSDQLKPGQIVMAMGNPFGLQQSVSAGVVSAVGLLGGESRNSDLIQHDASLNPGSSGGPLFSADGKVIGINSSIASRARNIGFAIPINSARVEIDDLRHGASHQRAYLGVSFEPISAELKQRLQLQSDKGVRLTKVDRQSPAATAGLQDGDVVVEFSKHQISTAEDFFRLINRARPGAPQEIELLRDGQVRQMTITPQARPRARTLW